MDSMTRRILAVLAVLAIGVTEVRAQYMAVPVAAPGVYAVRTRPYYGPMRVRARYYGVPVVDPMVAATTYVAPAPFVTTTRYMTPAPVMMGAPVVARPMYAPVSVYP